MIELILYTYMLLYRSLLLLLLLTGVLFGVVGAVNHIQEKDMFKGAYFVTIAFLSMFAYIHIVNGNNISNITRDNVDVLQFYSYNNSDITNLI